MIDQRNDELGNLRIQEVDRFQKRDHERLAIFEGSQKEVDALTKKNLEMACQIDTLETAAGANISASDNRERDYRQQIDKLESAAADAASQWVTSQEVLQLKEELDRYKNPSTQENEGYWFKRYTQSPPVLLSLIRKFLNIKMRSTRWDAGLRIVIGTSCAD